MTIAQAIQNGQPQVKHDGKVYMNLPTPQTSGTLTQQRAYAEQCERKALELAKDNPSVIIDYSEVYRK